MVREAALAERYARISRLDAALRAELLSASPVPPTPLLFCTALTFGFFVIIAAKPIRFLLSSVVADCGFQPLGCIKV